MNKKIISVLLLIFTVGLIMTGCGNSRVSMGTGNTSGNYYAYGNVLSTLVKESNDKYDITVRNTAGSAANLRLISQGFLDFAIVQSDVLEDAFNGKGSFADKPCTNVRAVAGLYMEECQIIVKADSDIFSVTDLYKRSVSVGEKESGVLENAKEILATYGLSVDAVDAKYLSFSESASALENGEIEAFFVTAGAPTVVIAELARQMDIRVLSLEERVIEQLINNYGGYVKCTIPAGTYIGQEEDIKTVGVKAVLVADSGLKDEKVNELTTIMFNHSDNLQYSTVATAINVNFATEGINVPFHNGAATYYAGANISVATDSSDSNKKGISVGQD